jgi:RND family efflux transporter MFP subunit
MVENSATRSLPAVWCLAAVAVITGGFIGCTTATQDNHIPPVRTALVHNIDTGSTNTYSANIQPYQQVDLSFKSNGYLTAIKQVKDADGHIRNIDQGDYVAKGSVLANVQPDDDDARAQDQTTQAGIDNAKAQIAEAQIALSYCELRAPFDAWVLKRNVDVGTLVGPATNGFTLADTRTVKAVFGVPDTAIGRIKPGSPQTILTEALPKPFSGHVTAISAAADPKSRVYSVEVRIDNPENLLKSGMIASITLGNPGPAGGVMVVPISAVVRSPANPAGFGVFLAEGSGDTVKVRTQEVTLGNTYGNMIAVNSGLKDGDRVVTSGTNIIKNGDEVRIIP